MSLGGKHQNFGSAPFHPKEPGGFFARKLRTFWHRVTFADVNQLMQEAGAGNVNLEKLKAVPYITETVRAPNDYPEFEHALPQLRKSVFRSLLSFERKTFWLMFFIHMLDVHLSIAGALLSVQLLRTFEKPSTGAASQYSWRMVDAVFPVPTQQELFIFSGSLALVIFVLNVAAATLHAQKIEREMLLVYRIQARLTQYIYAFILRMSRQDRTRLATGDIVNLAQADARANAEFFAHAMVDFPVLFLSVGVIVAIMRYLLGPSAWVGLALLSLQIPMSLFFSWLGTRLQTELMRRSDSRISRVTEWVGGMRLVRYFGWSRHFEGEIKASAQSEFRQDLKLKSLYSFSFALSTSWWMVVSVGIFAGFVWLDGSKGDSRVDASRVFAAIWLTAVLGHQLNPLPWFVTAFSGARVGSVRIQRLFSNRLQEEEFADISSNHAQPLTEENASVAAAVGTVTPGTGIGFEIENLCVHFAADEPPILQNINLRIEPGSLTAFVGAVGSGKSILIQTLMGEVVPDSGRVMVFTTGSNAVQHSVHSPAGLALLRSAQTYVPQEAFVASATVRENVPLHYLDASKEPHPRDSDVVNSLYAASLGLDLDAFPEGLSTELGERGVNLSGGQKQRLSLARSVFSTDFDFARVVFLDDPLSAVDTRTEADLAHRLLANRWRAGAQTIVWATHRLAHLNLVDKVVVLGNGRIVEQGAFDALMSDESSRLFRLMRSQTHTEQERP